MYYNFFLQNLNKLLSEGISCDIALDVFPSSKTTYKINSVGICRKFLLGIDPKVSSAILSWVSLRIAPRSEYQQVYIRCFHKDTFKNYFRFKKKLSIKILQELIQ